MGVSRPGCTSTASAGQVSEHRYESLLAQKNSSLARALRQRGQCLDGLAPSGSGATSVVFAAWTERYQAMRSAQREFVDWAGGAAGGARYSPRLDSRTVSWY